MPSSISYSFTSANGRSQGHSQSVNDLDPEAIQALLQNIAQALGTAQASRSTGGGQGVSAQLAAAARQTAALPRAEAMHDNVHSADGGGGGGGKVQAELATAARRGAAVSGRSDARQRS
jgi:hypothetical protein